MKSRLFFAFVLVIVATLAATWAVAAQQSQPPMPQRFVEQHIASSSHEAVTPDWTGEKPFRHPADFRPNTATAAVSLGQPGTSFRYVQTFGEVENGYLEDNNHFYDVSGIATDGTNLWVTDSWGNRVVKFDSSGNFLQKIGQASYTDATGTSLDFISDIEVDSTGSIWVVDSGANHVVKFNASGQRVSELGQAWNGGSGNDQFNDPISIAFDSAGNIYVSDSGIWYGGGNHRIQIFNSSGTYLHTIGETGVSGSDNNHFNYPRRIAIYANTLYIPDAGNQRVQIFNVSNPAAPVYIATLGVTGVSSTDNLHFDQPEGVGVDASYIYVADSNNNRIQIFNRATRAYVATIGTGSYGTGAYEFNHPTDISMDTAGNIYVADDYNKRVQQYNSSRVYLRTYGTTGVSYVTDGYHYHRPTGVAVDTDGSVYITEERGHRLVKLDAASNLKWTVGEPGQCGNDNSHFCGPNDVAVDGTGHVYVVESWDSPRVQVFTSGGAYYTTLGVGWGTGNEQFKGPNGVTVDKNSNIYVADTGNHRVQIYNAGRIYVATLGVTGAAGSDNAHFNSPNDVAVDANGTIYVADETNHRVQVFDVSRQYVRTIGEAGVTGSDYGHLSSWGPHRLSVDTQNRLYVSDAGNNRIQVFDATGAYLTTIGGSSGAQNGRFRGAMGVAIGPDGAVYVAEWTNNRVQKFALGVPGWVQTNINGFGDRSNSSVDTLASFAGSLYAGTYNWSGNGAQVWRTSDGSSWTPVMTNGFGITRNVGIDHLFAFNGQMYVGTWADEVNGGEVWRSGNGVDWTRVVSQGFGDPNNGEVYRFAVFSNTLYASTWSYTTTRGLEIWRSSTGNSGDWTRVISNGFNGNVGNLGATAMEVFNGYLYAGTYNWNSTAITTTGGDVWRTNDGSTWLQVNTSGFGTVSNGAVTALAAFDGYLYAATYREVWQCQVCDNSDWTKVVDEGFGNSATGGMNALEVFDNRLYFVVGNSATGLEVWRTANGTNWEQVGSAGFGDSNNNRTYWDNAVTTFNNRLYIGTQNGANGGEIWKKTVTADFSANRILGQPALDVTFTNASAGDYTTSLWDFGDGVTSTLTSPTHTFSAIGTYTVTLTVGDGVDTNTLARTSYIRVVRLVFLPLVRR